MRQTADAQPFPPGSSLRQVLNAAEDVVADYGGHLLLISVFKCPDQSVVLPSRFLVRPPSLRAVRERPPQQPQEEKKHRRACALVDPKMKLPVEFRQPTAAGAITAAVTIPKPTACRNMRWLPSGSGALPTAT